MCFSASPHVIEPDYPAAIDRYVNLGQFYDVDALKQERETIHARTTQYKAHYQRAYRALRAAGEAEDELRGLYGKDFPVEKMMRRMDNICKREIRGSGNGTGRVSKRYLGGLTCKGELYRFDTVHTLASRVYVLVDRWGMGSPALKRVLERATIRGYDAIACPDEYGRLAHVILPELSLAFVTEREGMGYPYHAHRRIHLDRMANLREVREHKGRCAFYQKLLSLLREEAAAALSEAKAAHDRLEEAYHPYVDFDGVMALAAAEWKRIEKRL